MSQTPFSLENKNAIVTGAGRGGKGIGKGIALALAHAGANVLITARTNIADAEAVAEAVRTETGKQAWAVSCDVSDTASVEQLFAQAKDLFAGAGGTMDILVNNGGHHARRFASPHDRRRMGRRDEREPQRHVRLYARRRQNYDQAAVGPDYQYHVDYGPHRKCGAGQLFGFQSGDNRLHAHGRPRIGEPGCHRQRGRAGLHPNANDRRNDRRSAKGNTGKNSARAFGHARRCRAGRRIFGLAWRRLISPVKF